MAILNRLKEKESWLSYLEFIESNPLTTDHMLIKNINSIIDKGVENIKLNFPIPQRKEIAKYKNDKKRTIYSFGEPYNTYLKCLNYIMQKDSYYSKQFCDNSVAYQQGKSVKRYITNLGHDVAKGNKRYFIKTDFSDFFNSIDQKILLKRLSSFILVEDADLYELLKYIITREDVYVNGKIELIKEKGVMAGIPISGYLSNIYMNDVDWAMKNAKIKYIRYADDVLILTNNIERDKETFTKLLEPLNVKLNPKKIDEGNIKDGLTFLGFKFENNRIDISDHSLFKMKNRIKRRSRWFSQWLSKNKVQRDVATRTFIKGMNKKLFTRDSDDQTCWLEWYGKNITTDESLREIDAYMLQYCRYLLSGKHKGYKKHAEIPYEDIKKLGYRSLVNEYWKARKLYLKENE